MSRKPENTFISGVHRHLPAGIYHMKNSNAYLGGVPDVWYSGPLSDLWVEYKFIESISRNGVKPNLSELQREWLDARTREGRNCAVIVGNPDGGVILTEAAQWNNTFTKVAFSALVKDRKTVAQWIAAVVGSKNP